jgi:type IV secretory pathway VirB10-like protein
MPRYGYDYSLASSPRTGWRSRLAASMAVGVIAAISAVSGAAVALSLLGTAGTTAKRPLTLAAHVLTPSVPVVQTTTPATPRPPAASATGGIVAQPEAPVTAAQSAPVSPAALPAAPQTTAAPVSQAAAAVVAVEASPTAHVPEKELTFTQGYARRRAVQVAADAKSGAKADRTALARVETHAQFGRPATKIKPRAFARTTAPQDQRRLAEMREERGPFSRFEQPNRFDFGRHQALAYGDPRDPRAERRPPARGGPFGASNGFFGGVF